MLVERRPKQVLRDQVCTLLLCAYLLDTDVTQVVMITNKMAVEFYVFVYTGDDRVLNHLYVCLVIFVQHSCFLFFSTDFGEQVSKSHDILCAYRRSPVF